MIEKKRKTLYFRLSRPLFHAILICVVFFLSYKLRLITDLIPGLQLTIPAINVGELQLYAIFSAIAFVFVGLFTGLYDLTKPLSGYWKWFIRSWFLWFVLITFVAYFGFGIIFSGGISRLIISWSVFAVFLLLFSFDVLWNELIYYFQRFEPYRVLCVYDDISKFNRIKKHLDSSYYDLVGMEASYRRDVDYRLYDYVLAAGVFDLGLLQQEFDKIRLAHHMFLHVSDGLFLDDVVYHPLDLGEMQVMAYSPSTLGGWQIVFKRLGDIFIGTLLCICLLPLMLVVALLIKLDSPGPILYLQQRIGRNAQSFTFVKFRTMHIQWCVGDRYGGKKAWEYKEKLMNSSLNIRQGELQKIANDPRVTFIGRFLRKTSLDELPSLFLVVWGTMSLVGPRPHELFEVDRYKSWQKRLLSMKPGVTGYAQIHGRDTLSFDQEAKYDLYYMQHWSLFFDLYILLMTIKVVLAGR